MESRESRGCFFCRTGKEAEVVRRFLSAFPGSRAIVPTRTRIRRKTDMALVDTVPLLPGYVFFEMQGLSRVLCEADEDRTDHGTADPDSEPWKHEVAALRAFARESSVLRLLRYTDGDWRLHGSDDQFAEMFFRTDGNIGVSQACFDEGNRIRILSGFLKDYEGSIVRVNRKTLTVEVSVDFHDKNMRMWLGYELVTNVADGDQTRMTPSVE